MVSRATAPIVVAVDGPSGVGKSTAARRLAGRLGLPFLDTGAMYRAMALAVLRGATDPGDRTAVERLAEGAEVGLRPRPDGSFEVLLDGEAVEGLIRTPEVTEAASTIAGHPRVRRRLVDLQRAAAGRFGGVLDGRDIGTRVFPDTPHKFFLDARPEVRFARRHAELTAAGRQVTLDQIRDEMERRDARDREREDSPLTRDASYLFIDTSDLDIDEVVDRMAHAIADAATP